AGPVSCEWVTAEGASGDKTIFYLHGGGYCLGSVESHRHMISYLSDAAGARALSVDYRLAPEHPHPAAVEDAVSAYQWLLKQGTDPEQIVIGGDSAGGGLTVATLVALRDKKIPLPAGAVCLSPWVDLEGVGESMTSKAGVDPMVQKDGLDRLAAYYLAEHHPQTPLAAPLHADLSGLPPMLIHVGTHETLLDDSLRLADRAKKAGVDVTLEPWEEMVHVWHFFAPIVPESMKGIARLGEYIRQRLG
ncbi:MAG: alpha/beta hydrolase, partial [Bdellovibrionota bacterium]